MSLTVRDVYDAIDAIAPFDACEEWDNVGLLVGSMGSQVTNVLCALDVNLGVIDEAIERGANLIVSHHPVIFSARKNLCEDEVQGRLLCKLVRNNIACIAAHTNFDNATLGVNDALADKLGLTDIEICENGMRIGTAKADTLGEFVARASAALGGCIRCYGEEERVIRRVAVLGGAGGGFADIARAAGADVYLTGEISHHKAWDAYSAGMCVLEAGHAATEEPAIHLLSCALQARLEGVECKVSIFESRAPLFK